MDELGTNGRCAGEDAIFAYCAGECSPLDRTRLERHLAECDQCRSEVSSVIRMVSAEETPEEAALIDAICDGADGAAGRNEVEPRAPVSLGAGLSPASAVAAVGAGLLIVVGVTLWLAYRAGHGG